VPPDFDGNVPLYPYTSGIGPWTRGPQWPVVNDRFQCMGITGQANRERQKSTRSRPSDREGELRLVGHKDPFPAPGLSGHCRFGQRTFAGRGGKEEEAP